MPNYRMLCRNCDTEFPHMQSIHELLYAFCPDCDTPTTTAIVSSVPVHGVGSSAARRQYQTERERDIAAYKRLRKDGVQPKGVTGAAEIETRAGEKHEVERDVVFEDRKMAKRFERSINDIPA